MTALCGGGASGPKATSPAASYLIGNSLENVVQAALGVSEVWASLLVFAAAQSIPWDTFCTTDPPSMPTFTVSDIETITTQPWNIGDPAFGKLVDLIEIGAWYYGCQCNTVVTPAPPAYPTFPNGAQQPNNTTPPVPFTGACLKTAATVELTLSAAADADFTQAWFGATALHTVTPSGGFTVSDASTLPAGATSFDCSGSFVNPGSANTGALYFVWYDSTGTRLNQTHISRASGSPFSFTNLAIPAGSVYVVIEQDSAFGAPGTICTFSMTLTFHCSAQPSPITPCCPPDPSLLGQLQLIFNMVQGIYQALPAPLNSFAESTVHAGLSGNGTVPIGAQTIAVKVTITTDIPGAVIDAGSPSYYFNRGYIVPITLEAPIAATRKLVYNPQVFMLPKLTEQVGYSLPVGLVVSITELVPGP